jgi:hypothetical protein
LPIGIARRFDTGGEDQLTPEEREKYAEALRRYEEKRGSASAQHGYRGDLARERFDTEAQANAWARENLPPSSADYKWYEIVKRGGLWRIMRLR